MLATKKDNVNTSQIIDNIIINGINNKRNNFVG